MSPLLDVPSIFPDYFFFSDRSIQECPCVSIHFSTLYIFHVEYIGNSVLLLLSGQKFILRNVFACTELQNSAPKLEQPEENYISPLILACTFYCYNFFFIYIGGESRNMLFGFE